MFAAHHETLAAALRRSASDVVVDVVAVVISFAIVVVTVVVAAVSLFDDAVSSCAPQPATASRKTEIIHSDSVLFILAILSLSIIIPQEVCIMTMWAHDIFIGIIAILPRRSVFPAL